MTLVFGVIDEVADIIRRLQRGLVAAADPVAEADAQLHGVAEQGASHGPALGHEGDLPRLQVRPLQGRRKAQRGALVEVDHALAVGPAEDHAGLLREVAQLLFHGHAFSPDFGETGGEDNDGVYFALRAVFYRVENAFGRQADDHGVDLPRDLRQGRVAGQAGDFLVLRVHRVDLSRVVVPLHEINRLPYQLVRILGGSQDGHRFRVQQGCEL